MDHLALSTLVEDVCVVAFHDLRHLGWVQASGRGACRCRLLKIVKISVWGEGIEEARRRVSRVAERVRYPDWHQHPTSSSHADCVSAHSELDLTFQDVEP